MTLVICAKLTSTIKQSPAATARMLIECETHRGIDGWTKDFLHQFAVGGQQNAATSSSTPFPLSIFELLRRISCVLIRLFTTCLSFSDLPKNHALYHTVLQRGAARLLQQARPQRQARRWGGSRLLSEITNNCCPWRLRIGRSRDARSRKLLRGSSSAGARPDCPQHAPISRPCTSQHLVVGALSGKQWGCSAYNDYVCETKGL
jgi:hypothetical protein